MFTKLLNFVPLADQCRSFQVVLQAICGTIAHTLTSLTGIIH